MGPDFRRPALVANGLWHYNRMQTRIDIVRADGDAPGRSTTRSYGDFGNPRGIPILNGTARKFLTRDSVGAFSLKWILQGAARYSVEHLHHYLSAEKVLLLVPGQSYEVEFLDRTGTESFCLFLSEPLLREALTDAERYDDLLAATRSGPSCDPMRFADTVFKPPRVLSSSLHTLRENVNRDDVCAELLEQALLSLLDKTISIGDDHLQLAERIPAKRPATRRKLLSRLQRVKEMIEDCPDRVPDLDELARASCLSKFHLLRLFAETFGATSIEYARHRQVERAMRLLRHSRLSIAQISETLGYESQSAFTLCWDDAAGLQSWAAAHKDQTEFSNPERDAGGQTPYSANVNSVSRGYAMNLNLNQIAQIALPVSDTDRAEAFYENVIGLRKLFRFADLSFFDCAGVRLLLDKVKDPTGMHLLSLRGYRPDRGGACKARHLHHSCASADREDG
jgi:AraC-like DNA-binding protein